MRNRGVPGHLHSSPGGDPWDHPPLQPAVVPSPATVATAGNKAFVDRMVETVRAAGFATNDGEWAQEPKIAALAVPIYGAGQVMGCLNVVFLRRAMSIGQAQLRYLPHLRAAADTISRRMSPAPAQSG